MQMNANLLPVGSVVLAKKVTKRFMICGILQQDVDTGTVYDYIGCPFPQGYLGADYLVLFNHSDIMRIDFLGFVDAESQVYRAAISKGIEENQQNEDSQ